MRAAAIGRFATLLARSSASHASSQHSLIARRQVSTRSTLALMSKLESVLNMHFQRSSSTLHCYQRPQLGPCCAPFVQNGLFRGPRLPESCRSPSARRGFSFACSTPSMEAGVPITNDRWARVSRLRIHLADKFDTGESYQNPIERCCRVRRVLAKILFAFGILAADRGAGAPKTESSLGRPRPP